MTLELEKNREVQKLSGRLNELPGTVLTEFPCGILRCTYEKHPKALYANDQMFQFLGTDENSEDWKEFIQQNIFFMIPFEERELFKSDLQRAATSSKPLPIRHWIRSCSGGKSCFMGWIQTINTAAGEREYVFCYIPISETCLVLQNERETAYESVLKGVFDAIFSIRWSSKMMECIHAKSNIQLPNTPGIQMIYDNRVWREFLELVWEEDRPKVERFFIQHRNMEGEDSARRRQQIEFRIMQENTIKDMQIIAVDMEGGTTLFCCREITHEKYMEHVAEEMECIRTISLNVSKSEKDCTVKSATYRFSQDYVYLQSGNDENFGSGGIPVSEFLRYNEISDEEFQSAIQDGMIVLSGEECSSEVKKRILYVVRRAGIAEKFEEYMLFLYSFMINGALPQAKKPRVRIHTFGYFDVFVEGKPIVFRYEKSKEMLAILVDRKGSFVSNPYFISCLWGDEPYSEKVRSRCRQVAYRMMETLKQYGIEDIIEKVDGHRRIIPEKIECDYFDYVDGKKAVRQMFNGAYMSDYSWGEETLSMLLKNTNYISGES